MSKIEIDENEIRHIVREFIRDNLRIDVNTSSEYTGGMDGGSLYSDSQTIIVSLGDEVICEAYL